MRRDFYLLKDHDVPRTVAACFGVYLRYSVV